MIAVVIKVTQQNAVTAVDISCASNNENHWC